MRKNRSENHATAREKKRRGKGCFGFLLMVGVTVVIIGVVMSGSGDDETTGDFDRCEPVNASLMTAIEEGLRGYTLSHAEAVRSNDFESAWFVAGIVDGTEGEPALWVANDISQGRPELLYSVNDVALDVSDWGDGTGTDAAFSPSDDGASEAIGCVSDDQ